MRPNFVYLNQLNTSSRNYKVRVHVIEKGRPKLSSKKGILYQNLLLEDEQGSKMQGTLFGEQISGFKQALMYNGFYEVANAPIKPCEEQWRMTASTLDYQMTFGQPAIVQRLEGTQDPILPQYRNIAQISKTADPDEKYDIVVVVLYVEPEPRRIARDEGRVMVVREIAVIDHSTEQPLIISAWSDLAEDECNSLLQKAEQLQVVAFTALKVSSHRGFSMATTMSSTIDHSPTGDKPRALADWASLHQAKLSEIQARLLTLRGLLREQQSTTISDIRKKKIQSTLQDEKYTLQVTIPTPAFEKVNAYLGCSRCSRRTNTAAGNLFTCAKCSTPDAKSIPRITFNCDVSDGTGILPITAFTTDAEKIFQMPAPDIFRMKHSEDITTFELLKNRLQTVPFSIEVGPNTSLSMNNVLQWVLKRVIEADVEQPKTSAPQQISTNAPHPDQETTATNSTPQVPASQENCTSALQTSQEATGAEKVTKKSTTDQTTPEQTTPGEIQNIQQSSTTSQSQAKLLAVKIEGVKKQASIVNKMPADSSTTHQTKN